MNKAIIIKIKFPYLNPNANGHVSLEILQDHLTLLMHATLRSFWESCEIPLRCFVEYPPTLDAALQELLTHYPPLPPHIFLIPTPERTIFSHFIKDPMIAAVDALKLADDATLYFLRLPYNAVYSPTFLTTLRQYAPVPEIKTLLFDQDHVYQSALGCVYVCSGKEYRMYFRIYDYCYPDRLEQRAHLFPHEHLFNNMGHLLDDVEVNELLNQYRLH